MKRVSSYQLCLLSFVIIAGVEGSPSNYLADASINRIKSWIQNESQLWLAFPARLETGTESGGVNYEIAVGGTKLKSLDDVKRVGEAKLTPGNSNGPDILSFSMSFVNLAVDYDDIVFYEKEILQNVSVSLKTNGVTVDINVAFEGDDDTCVGTIQNIQVHYDNTKLVATGGDNCPQAKLAVQNHFQNNIQNSLQVLTFSSAVSSLYKFDLCRTGPTPVPTVPTPAPTTLPPAPTTLPPAPTTLPPAPTTITVPPPITTKPTPIPTKKPPPSPPAPASELANKLGQFMTTGFQKNLYEWATIPQYTSKTSQLIIIVGQANFVTTSISLSNAHYEVNTASHVWVLTQTLELKNMVAHYPSITYALTGNMTYDHVSGDNTIADTRVNVSFPVLNEIINEKTCVQVNAGSQKWDNDLKWPSLNFVQTPGEKQHDDLKAILEDPKVADFKTIITQIVDMAIQYAVQNAQAWCKP